MNISKRKQNEVTLLDLDGNFTAGEDCQFGQLVETDIESGGRKLVVSLAK